MARVCTKNNENRGGFCYLFVTCVEVWHFLLPARKGPGAACTKVTALYHHLWAKMMQKLACPRAFTVQEDREKIPQSQEV